jgi:Rrf2 family transcriptional regulator, nitric oxide-sensitive transcriptional repressor
VNKIHRKLEYALIALKHMNQKRPGELTTVKEICQKYGTPFDATARVLQQLVQGKFLKSEQGAYGGYVILRDLTKVSLRELIEKVVGPIEMVKCMGESPALTNCELKETCNIMIPLISLNEKLVKFYENINVHELLTTGKRSPEFKQIETVADVQPVTKEACS